MYVHFSIDLAKQQLFAFTSSSLIHNVNNSCEINYRASGFHTCTCRMELDIHIHIDQRWYLPFSGTAVCRRVEARRCKVGEGSEGIVLFFELERV